MQPLSSDSVWNSFCVFEVICGGNINKPRNKMSSSQIHLYMSEQEADLKYESGQREQS